jgi:pilus assembly protein CpaC
MSSRWWISIPIAGALALGAARTEAQPRLTSQESGTEQITLEVGETRLLKFSEKIIRISVADPDVADVQVVTPLQLLVTARKVGYTDLILWSETDQPLALSVSITRNLDQLRKQYTRLFPKSEIDVSSAGDLIVLAGTVDDLRLPARAAEIAGLYSDRIANLIEVSGDQQVQLDVRFAEVSRSGMRKIGLNFLWNDPTGAGYVAGQATPGSQAGGYLRGNLRVPGTGTGGPPLIPVPSAADGFNMFFSTGLSDFPFSTILSILSQEGLAKVLAEPTLVALSGQEALFHAGGEVPILTAQDIGRVSVDYKQFGVRLKFTPTVLGERTVSLKLAVEVSEPDATAGTTLGGFVLPGFRARRTETTVRLKDGQSFAVAGLLSDSIRTTVNKVPFFGDIPILGALFRSTAYMREETELLVVVTVHLVQPLKPGEVPLLPGEDLTTDPGDLELFLLGRIEPKRSEPERTTTPKAATSSNEPLGPIGFARD